MKIQIDGTNTVNKGAELMLYAVLERLEETYGNAKVLYVPSIRGKYTPIDTTMALEERTVLRYSRYPEGVLRRLGWPRSFFTAKYPKGDIDVVLDAGGFQFSDQWGYPTHYIDLLENYYKKLNAAQCKIIFLPQAFGPFKSWQGQRSVEIMNTYADLIIAREQVSYDHLIASGVAPHKIKMYPDFTLAVSGQAPQHLSHLKGKVCLVPNKKMITHASSASSRYLEVIQALIANIIKSGKEIFLLNHEGEGDLKICHQLNASFNNTLEVISGLNAKEIKGVIGSSYMVISSRFHGVASALSQGVPCLSTSWNHKYKMLFKDYKLDDMVLDVQKPMEVINGQVNILLDAENNASMRAHLLAEKEKLSLSIDAMWHEVFEMIEK